MSLFPANQALHRHRLSPIRTIARTALFIWLAVCLGIFLVRSIHWPQVNDPAQISYLCFLMDHGFAPYRYLIEMNMPGIYLTNWSVAHVLGTGSLSWRTFDFLLISAALAAMIFIARTHGWLYGFFAGALFALFHGQDGPAQLGQRDFIVTVLFLCAYAFLFEALRRDKNWLLFLRHLFCGTHHLQAAISAVDLLPAGRPLLAPAIPAEAVAASSNVEHRRYGPPHPAGIRLST